jgi:uncharacterized protein (TIGR00369 family)
MILSFKQRSAELFSALFFYFKDFMMDIFTKVAKSFESQAFMKTIGAKLDSVDEGRVVISVELKPSMMQQHGFGHAGVTFSIGDSAAGYAALTKMGKNQEVLTSEMKIHLMSPADGKILKAVGSVLKAGRRLLVVQSNIYSGDDKNEKLIATMLGTMVPSIVDI